MKMPGRIFSRPYRFVILGAALLGCASRELPLERDDVEFVKGRYQVTAAGGLGLDPERTFALLQGLVHVEPGGVVEAPFGSLSLGPLLQVGFGKDELLLAPAATARSTVEIPYFPLMSPYLEGGIGALIWDRKGEPTLGSFLLLLGGGLDHRVAEHVSLSVKTYLNFTAGPAEQFFMAVLAGASYHF